MASGGHGDGQLLGRAELLDEASQRFTKIVECLVLAGTLAVGSKTGTQLGVCAPNAVFVLFYDDGHGDGP